MKKLLMIFPLVILLCLNFGCPQGEETAEEQSVDVEADVKAIRTFYDDVTKVFNEGDLERLMALFDGDAVLMPPRKPFIIGKEAIHDYYHFDQVTYDVAISIDEIQIRGNRVYVRFTWAGTRTQGEETKEVDHYEGDILQKGPDGSWKSLYAIWY